MAVPVAAASHFTDSESRSKHPLSAQRQNSDKMGAFRGFEMRRWRDFPEPRSECHSGATGSSTLRNQIQMHLRSQEHEVSKGKYKKHDTQGEIFSGCMYERNFCFASPQTRIFEMKTSCVIEAPVISDNLSSMFLA
ncbi:uncharacterized protein RSE6_13702 [Rhynchosporium secalis]|uniref:Uncharacterized protein n=1 Tax=Rhynchosporium secalis TaxID=38038 RepID=A0A1E1MTI9_RHYSE|nr:uncharacterized protein RSE6_13702 [Rhynchosporium secalis]